MFTWFAFGVSSFALIVAIFDAVRSRREVNRLQYELDIEIREHADLLESYDDLTDSKKHFKERANELETECQRLDGINRELEAEAKRLRERNKNFEKGTAWEAFRQQSIASKRYAREVEAELAMARCEILALQARLASDYQ